MDPNAFRADNTSVPRSPLETCRLQIQVKLNCSCVFRKAYPLKHPNQNYMLAVTGPLGHAHILTKTLRTTFHTRFWADSNLWPGLLCSLRTPSVRMPSTAIFHLLSTMLLSFHLILCLSSIIMWGKGMSQNQHRFPLVTSSHPEDFNNLTWFYSPLVLSAVVSLPFFFSWHSLIQNSSLRKRNIQSRSVWGVGDGR